MDFTVDKENERNESDFYSPRLDLIHRIEI